MSSSFRLAAAMGLVLISCAPAADRSSTAQVVVDGLVKGLPMRARVEDVRRVLPVARFEEYRGLAAALPDSATGFTDVLVKFDVAETGVSERQQSTELVFFSTATTAQKAESTARSMLRGAVGREAGEGCIAPAGAAATIVRFWQTGDALVALRSPVAGDKTPTETLPPQITTLHIRVGANSPTDVFGGDFSSGRCVI